ncbi:probable cytochrome P450 49a1 isoform X2 [Schistocerca serialis cubense]|uniref:probable cytochrome P450 49a1 isoform X2 n=1 Tax=Schistocerca serialis cubense TaxID=2023355 RepID=UPI00214DFCFD|nr:probable cytochrome P450 49a1 isoform X2 [Schistocerca serialis cubense]
MLSASSRCSRQLAVVLSRGRATTAAAVKGTMAEPTEEWLRAKPFEEMPGPKPLPIIGNTWRFLMPSGDYKTTDMAEMMFQMHQQYGDIAKLVGLPGRPPMVFCFNANDVEKVYRNEGPRPVRDTVQSIKYYRGVTRKDWFGDVLGVAITHFPGGPGHAPRLPGWQPGPRFRTSADDRGGAHRVRLHAQTGREALALEVHQHARLETHGQGAGLLLSGGDATYQRGDGQNKKAGSSRLVSWRTQRAGEAAGVQRRPARRHRDGAGHDVRRHRHDGDLRCHGAVLPEQRPKGPGEAVPGAEGAAAGRSLSAVHCGRVGGLQVSQGLRQGVHEVDMVLANIVLTNSNEHFSRASEFIPERWLKDVHSAQTAHPFAFMPFGFGPRMCIGRRFAELEIYTLLARVVRRFQLHFDGEMRWRTTVLHAPVTPLTLKVTVREQEA